MEVVAAVAAVIVLAALLLRSRFDRITVFEFERALRYKDGRLRDVLPPGRHWIYRPRVKIVRVDIRPRVVAVPGQEVLTADGVSLKASIAATYRVADPVAAINSVENYELALYTTVQIALRELVGGAKVDDLLERRDEFSARLLALAADPASELGVELIACNIKDIMVPGALKKMFAQVVQAQKEGQAALERARGETAALRNLANAARMIEEKPALMQLRLIQEVGSQTGNTIILGLPQSSNPIPLRDKTPDEEEPRELRPGGHAPTDDVE